ncbi:MAG TPA: hypothetical protein VKQ11_07210 [Candidatus Sulfotelmatobacter sp.]|nr:hypothetical protein [Candidatus Sulfotelmatobacter sp.]
MKNAGKFAAILGVTLPSSYLFWLVLVGTFSLHELLIGVIAAALTAAGMLVVTVNYPAPFSPTLGELLTCWRLSWYLLSGTWEVLSVAAKDALGVERGQSLFRVSRYEPGTKEDPHRTARRVLAVVYTTAAPNFIVLGINPNQRTLLFHQIKRSSVPQMTEQLGARA